MDGPSITCDGKYQSALEFLYGRINYERTARGVPAGSRLNLDRMRKLLERLGNPQDALQAIHIAGTKGKGSTAAMIAASLTAAGYQTGLYTSPHLERLEERIRINAVECTPAELVDLVDSLRGVVAELDREGRAGKQPGNPTFFEITTAMAMLHFARRDIDAAVLEVGLGGRLDSTNLCRPVITVITSISFDHTQQLGNTLAAIAREKAGIVKPKVSLVCGATQEEALGAIQPIADQRQAPMYRLGKDFDFQYSPPPHSLVFDGGGSIDYYDSLGGVPTELQAVAVGMLGRHQAANAAIAIATLRRLQADGWEIPESAVRSGIRTAHCAARIEVLARDPLIILDTAHNVASVLALLSVLDEVFRHGRRTLIFAATRDKDVSGMLRQLLPRFDSVILTRYVDNPRGVAPARLLELVDKLRAELSRVPDVLVCESPAAAWQTCQSMTGPESLVCVTGSFFLAGEMRSMITMNHPMRVG